MADLIIYNSAAAVSTPSQLFAANLALMRYPSATVKDVAGVTTGDITTYVTTTLVDDTYTNIFICCTTQAAGATGLLSFDQVAALRAKMITASKGTTVRANTCDTNAVVTNIVLDSGASAVNDAYLNMYIETAGTTAVLRHISGYAGATKTCTTTTTTVAVTNVDTYIIYTNTNIYELGNTVAATGKTSAYRMWETLYPSAVPPLAVLYLGGYLFAEASGTAASVAAGTITLAATCAAGDHQITADHTAVDDLYNDMYVYIYSATTGAAQYRKITNYVASTQVCTLDSNWTITPTGTVVYRVVKNIEKIFADRAMQIWTKVELADIDEASAREYTRRLCDYYGALTASWDTEVDQDLALVAKISELGTFAFKADATAYI